MPERHDQPSRFGYLGGRKTLVGKLHALYNTPEGGLTSLQIRHAISGVEPATPSPQDALTSLQREDTPPVPDRRSKRGNKLKYKRAQPFRSGGRR